MFFSLVIVLFLNMVNEDLLCSAALCYFGRWRRVCFCNVCNIHFLAKPKSGSPIFFFFFTGTFFHGKMCSDYCKTKVVDRKKQKALSLLYVASGPLLNPVNSSDVPPEFAAENNKDELLEGKFRNLNFRLPPNRHLNILLNFFFPFIDIKCFSLKFKTSVLSNIESFW